MKPGPATVRQFTKEGCVPVLPAAFVRKLTNKGSGTGSGTKKGNQGAALTGSGKKKAGRLDNHLLGLR